MRNVLENMYDDDAPDPVADLRSNLAPYVFERRLEYETSTSVFSDREKAALVVQKRNATAGATRPVAAAVRLAANGNVGGVDDALNWVPHLVSDGSVAWFPKSLTPEERAANDAAKARQAALRAGARLRSSLHLLGVRTWSTPPYSSRWMLRIFLVLHSFLSLFPSF
jgi:hypothetical protein